MMRFSQRQLQAMFTPKGFSPMAFFVCSVCFVVTPACMEWMSVGGNRVGETISFPSGEEVTTEYTEHTEEGGRLNCRLALQRIRKLSTHPALTGSSLRQAFGSQAPLDRGEFWQRGFESPLSSPNYADGM